MTFDLFARAIALGLHFLRAAYWIMSAGSARKLKPPKKKRSNIDLLERGITILFGIGIGFQLLGLQIVPFANNSIFQAIGLLLVIIGISMSMLARINLGTNWAHAAEYQVKIGQTLVTNGIYAYIRHPIYFGMSLAYIGAEIIAGSKLFLILTPVLAFITLRQANKEEVLLSEKFGTQYTNYRKRSYRFIPFIY